MSGCLYRLRSCPLSKRKTICHAGLGILAISTLLAFPCNAFAVEPQSSSHVAQIETDSSAFSLVADKTVDFSRYSELDTSASLTPPSSSDSEDGNSTTDDGASNEAQSESKDRFSSDDLE